MLGNNIKFSIIRSNMAADDKVGGAMVTGTTSYTDIAGRLANSPAQELLLQQGLEINQIWRLQMKSMVTITEQDTVIVTAPASHPMFNQTFRVVYVRFPSFNDPRRFKQISLSRIVTAHSQQF